MSTGDRIRKLGFKRWYERTLLEGHAFLVTGFLALILAFGGFELIAESDGALAFLIGLGTTAAGALVSGLGLHRYFQMLVLAQSLGHRATCDKCNTYAAFTVLPEPATPPAEQTMQSASLRVRCRHCGNEWQI